MKALFSFYYFGDDRLAGPLDAFVERLGCTDTFADSGAFSALTMGATINLDDYMAWLRRFPELWNGYANLDVIDNPEATWQNQLAMEAEGFTPIPTFHVGEPWEYLERYLDSHEYIAIGGLVGHSKGPTLQRWLVRCFQMARGHKVHGFGVSSLRLLKMFPWYSYDTTGWITHRYGRLFVWDRDKMRVPLIGDWEAIYRLAPALRRLGSDPALLAPRGSARLYGSRQGSRKGKSDEQKEQFARERDEGLRTSIASWLALEEHVRSFHGTIAPPAGYHGDGPKHYFVHAGKTLLPKVAEVMKESA